MMQPPKSLTAVVHVKFHYGEGIEEPPQRHEVELLNKLMDRASELDPELQRILVQFAQHMEVWGQSPE